MRRLIDKIPKESEYFSKLKVIQAHAEPVLSNIQRRFPTYTLHDWNHSLSVDENITKYLFDDDICNKLSEDELFILTASAWLHDIGMAYIVDHDEDLETVRKDHHIRSTKYILEHFSEMTLLDLEARLIARICESHCYDDLSTIPETEPFKKSTFRTKFICACLRLGDVLDVTSDRAPEILFRMIKGVSPISDEYWDNHLNVDGLSKSNDTLYFKACFSTLRGESVLSQWISLINKELMVCDKIINSNNINLRNEVIANLYEYDFDRYDNRFGNNINTKGILDLIAKGIYNRNDIAIRELIQNSFDACKRRAKTSDKVDYGITFSKYILPNGSVYLKVADNGIGMSANDISEYVSVLAKSINDSEEVKEIFEAANDKLIAHFGIGILSCFTISKSITIRSCKKGYKAVDVLIKHINSKFKYSESNYKGIGTEIILELNEAGKKVDIVKSIKYFIKLSACNIYYSETAIDNISKTYDNPVDVGLVDISFNVPKAKYNISMKTDLYEGLLNFNGNEDETITLLQDGILINDTCKSVTSTPLNIFSGYINFKPKVVDLTASRTEIVQNDKFDSIKLDLTKIANKLLLDSMVIDFSNKEFIKEGKKLSKRGEVYFKLAVGYGYDPALQGIYANLPFKVHSDGNMTLMPLVNIKHKKKAIYYLQSDLGYVTRFTTFDNVELYKEDDSITLSKALIEVFTKGGDIIIETGLYTNSDKYNYTTTEIVKKYFAAQKIKLANLSDVENDNFKHKIPSITKTDIPPDIKNLFPNDISCLSIPNNNKLILYYENKFWLNYNHPSLKKIFAKSDVLNQSPTYKLLLRIYFNLITYKFEDAKKEIEALFVMSDVIEKDIDPVTSKQVMEVAKNIGLLDDPGKVEKKIVMLNDLKKITSELAHVDADSLMHSTRFELEQEIERLRTIHLIVPMLAEIKTDAFKKKYLRKEKHLLDETYAKLKVITEIARTQDIVSRLDAVTYLSKSLEELSTLSDKYNIILDIIRLKKALTTHEDADITNSYSRLSNTSDKILTINKTVAEIISQIELIEDSDIYKVIVKDLTEVWLEKSRLEKILKNASIFMEYYDGDDIDDIDNYFDELEYMYHELKSQIKDLA